MFNRSSLSSTSTSSSKSLGGVGGLKKLKKESTGLALRTSRVRLVSDRKVIKFSNRRGGGKVEKKKKTHFYFSAS